MFGEDDGRHVHDRGGKQKLEVENAKMSFSKFHRTIAVKTIYFFGDQYILRAILGDLFVIITNITAKNAILRFFKGVLAHRNPLYTPLAPCKYFLDNFYLNP